MNILSIFAPLIYPILFILPAWIANAVPVIFSGGGSLDFQMRFRGRPLLGRHKTVFGTTAALVGGSVIAVLEYIFLSYALLATIAIVAGAIFGDLLGSFIKRRWALREGSSVMFVDQYLFVVFAIIFAAPFGNLPSFIGIFIILILTGILHKLMNVLAYKAGMKKVPW